MTLGGDGDERWDAASLEHLLRPSLSQARATPAPYSVQAGFFVAFFGGGFASILFAGLNAHRLGRMRVDLPFLMAGALAFAAFYLAVGQWAAHAAPLPLLGALPYNPRMMRYAGRLFALCFFGLVFLRHRRFYKASEMAGRTPPSPWLHGIGCAIASIALSAALAGIGSVL